MEFDQTSEWMEVSLELSHLDGRGNFIRPFGNVLGLKWVHLDAF